jgi:CelD/BcsL family acetyltransferase involved in cellulose biosynthesis
VKILYYTAGAIPESVRAFWRAALRASEPSQALTAGPDWFEMKTESGSIPSFVAVVANDREEPQALLPLIEGHRDLNFGKIGRVWLRKRLSVLTVSGGNVICPVPLLPRELGQAYERILHDHPKADALSFYRIARNAKGCEGSAGLKIQGREFFTYVVIDAMPHYLLQVTENVRGPKDLRSAKSLSELRRQERKLAQEAGGECRLVEIRCRNDWEPHKEAIESMMNGAWQARWLGHDFSLENTECVARRGWLRSFVLMAGDKAVAFELSYQGEGQFILEQTGYDSKLFQLSPGAVMLHKVLERVLQNERPVYVDFGYGDGQYKRQLANQTVNVSNRLIVRRSLRLRAWLWLYRQIDGVRSLVGRMLRSTSIWRRVRQRLKRL